METQAAASEVSKERGWMLPLLLEGDAYFGHGRWAWWCESMDGTLPESPIPQINFVSASDNAVRPELQELSRNVAEKGTYAGPPLSASGARKHLEKLITKMGSGWESMLFLIRWIAWGLNCGMDKERPQPRHSYGDEAWDAMLLKEFHLGRLQAADCDVLGSYIAEANGNGFNPHAFFPTPMEVCTMMAQMTMADGPVNPERDSRLASVNDCCVGTGRMLLAASNFSVNLYATDIDPTMVDACSINCALYAPWAVYQTRSQRKMMDRNQPSEPQAQALLAQADDARQSQGHPPLPSVEVEPQKRVYSYNRHGQGDLFSVMEPETK
jgi:hypothetical protein